MPGDVTATATVNAGNLGIRKPRNLRVRKRRSNRANRPANPATRLRDRPSPTSASKSARDYRLPQLIGK